MPPYSTSHDTRPRRRLAVLALGVVLLLGLVAGEARAADYQLAPGDVIRLDIGGITQFAHTAQIANDGTVALPRFGRVEAAGKTIEQVQEAVRAKVTETVFRRFDMAGQVAYLDVTAEDVFVDVEAYRDISITGVVATPGPVPYRPGLTVRAAIASAGGILRQDTPGVGGGDMAGLVGQLSRLGQLRRERAQTLAELWRLRDELGEDVPPPDADRLGIPSGEAASLLALQQRLRTINARDHEEALAELDTLQQLTARRSDLLERQQQNQAAAVDADEADLARLRSLKRQGLVPNDQIRNVRRLQTLSTTQFLDTSNELERLEIEAAKLDGARRDLTMDYTQEKLERLVETQAELSRLDSAIEGLQLGMGVTGAPDEDGGDGGMAVKAVIHRGIGEQAQGMAADLDTLVQPGDVVEVRLDWTEVSADDSTD